jgi:hypothetical protein
MATTKQIAANRKNALRSTGPKSALGKTISSRNSTKNGFYSTAVVLPEEDRSEFIALARRLASAYAPRTVLEHEQVKIIVETTWQLRRVNVVDSELFQLYSFCDGENRGLGTAFAQDATQGNAFSKLVRYSSYLMKKLHSAKKELANLQATSSSSRSPGGHGGVDDTSAAQKPSSICDSPNSVFTQQIQPSSYPQSSEGFKQD